MEWLNELLGFLIVIIVFLLPVLSKFLTSRRQKKQPPPSPLDEEDEVYEEEEEFEEEYEPPPPVVSKKRPGVTKRLVKKDYAFHTDLEEREFESAVEERTLETQVDPHFKKRIVSQAFILPEKKKKNRKETNPIVKTLQNKDPLQAMVILSEVFGPPKSMQ